MNAFTGKAICLFLALLCFLLAAFRAKGLVDFVGLGLAFWVFTVFAEAMKWFAK